MQITLLISGVLLLSTLRFPAFGVDWLMSAFVSLAGAAWGLASLRRLWRSDDTRTFLRSGKLLPFLLGALVVSFVVGIAILIWCKAVVGFKNTDLSSVDHTVTLGFETVGLSLALGFILGLFEAAWKARQELP